MCVKISPKANRIIRELQDGGFEAYAVGGCVRNALLGIEPHDWDICTNAKPAEMRRIFSGYETHDYGLKHGTLVVMADGEPFEVTTYRIDGVYSDNRRPEKVTFTGDLTLDLSRRDFTVNAIAYNERDGIQDPFGGAEDLSRGILRCVGEPENRFYEDALRIMRGIRFASAYGFTVENKTAEAIHRCSGLLNNIAAERIQAELNGILCGAQAAETLDKFRDVIAVIIPELAEAFDFPQHNKHHRFDVWKHIINSVGGIEPDALLRTVMLLHDIGKPRACTTDANGQNHFKGHQQISADMSETILRRLKYPKAFSEECLELIIYHDVRYSGAPQQIKRLLQKLGESTMRRLFKVQRADVSAQSDYLRAEKLQSIDGAETRLDEIITENRCVRLSDLAVNGRDLIDAGFSEGRQIGIILNRLLDEVIDERLENEKTALLNRAKEL